MGQCAYPQQCLADALNTEAVVAACTLAILQCGVGRLAIRMQLVEEHSMTWQWVLKGMPYRLVMSHGNSQLQRPAVFSRVLTPAEQM